MFLCNINCYLVVLLALVAVVGDFIVAHTKIHVFQALFDNTTHAIIGGLSWMIVCLHFRQYSPTQKLLEIAVCAVIAALIDIDHFISARSLSLKDATNLPQRPPLHCSTLPFAVPVVIMIVSWWAQSDVWKRGSLIVLTAFLSHHTRDATRRGYWFHPFGSTPAIPYAMYVILTCSIPYLIYSLNLILKIQDDSDHSYKFLNNKESVI